MGGAQPRAAGGRLTPQRLDDFRETVRNVLAIIGPPQEATLQCAVAGFGGGLTVADNAVWSA